MGAALATVEVQHSNAHAPRKVRISTNVKRAIEAMVHDGKKRAEAAQIAGILDESLRQALTRQECCAYLNDQLRVKRTSAAARTVAKAEQLMDGAESEHVQADMTKWLAGLEGISPVQRTESTINLRAPVGPGLVILMVAAPDPLIRHQQSEGGLTSTNSRLPPPVPHPAWGKSSDCDAAATEISGELLAPQNDGEGKNRAAEIDRATSPASVRKNSSRKSGG